MHKDTNAVLAEISKRGGDVDLVQANVIFTNALRRMDPNEQVAFQWALSIWADRCVEIATRRKGGA